MSDTPGTEIVPAGERLAQVETVMRTDIDHYHSSGMAREHKQLLAAGAEPPVRGGAARLAEIERILQADIGEYWARGLDVEHRQLLEAKLAQAKPGTVTAAGDHTRQVLQGTPEGRDLLRRWDAKSEAGFWIRELRQTAMELTREVPGIDEAFDELPIGAQIAVFDHLARMPSVYDDPAPPEVISSFTATDIGADLVNEWGDDAALHVARVRDRAAWIFNSMKLSDQAAARDWFDRLQPRAMKAVVRLLAR